MRIALLVLGLIACGEPAATAPPPVTRVAPVATAPAPTPPTPTIPHVELHEWGLVGVELGSLEGSLATGPGTVGNGEGITRTISVEIGKPVIYAHLPDELERAQLSVEVRLRQGNLLELFPQGRTSEPTHRWTDVIATRGACHASSYPARGDAACATEDGYCEAIELPTYETTDSACLEVQGTRANNLFYRANIATMDLPLAVERTAEGIRVSNSSTETIPGQLVYVTERTDARSTARVAVIAPPRPSATLTLPTPTEDASLGAAALTAELATALTPEEIAAFERAWGDDFFGAAQSPDPRAALRIEQGQPRAPRELQPWRSALLYFLPAATIDREIAIVVDPPDTVVKRVMLVRVGLDAAPIARRPIPPRLSSDRSPPQVRVATVEATGMPTEAATRVARRYLGAFRACAQRSPAPNAQDPSLTVTVGTARVVAVEVTPDDGGPLLECLRSVAFHLPLSSPTAASVRIDLDLTF